jgi:signal transduction histidine kinase
MNAPQVDSAGENPPLPRRLNADLAAPLTVGAAVFVAALAGILLRPIGDLSAFWPANAILLGLMVRFPGLGRASGWAAAAAAFVAADALTGSSWTKAFLLSFANLSGIALGAVLFARLPARDRLLGRPSSLIAAMLIVLAASTLTSAFGGAINVLLFNGDATRGFFIWLAAELANYIVILPIVLTFPPPAVLKRRIAEVRRAPPNLGSAAPFVTYIICLAMVPVVGGPGAVAFPVPSLLWCALTYGLAASALLTLSFAVWTLVILSLATQHMSHLSGVDLISLRLGVMLVALAPITVASAIAERNELLREATNARKAAEDAMAARTLLLATMAHELRSPLTAVVGFSSRMSSQAFGPLGHAKYLDYSQSIELAGSHLSDLVSDLLDTARVEAGKFELTPAEVASRDLVEQSLRLVRGLAMDAGVSMVVKPGDWPPIWADGRAVKQVLINLLSNAVKFSPAGAAVMISATTDQGRLTLRVKDHGPGIREEDLPLLGRPFSQAGDEESRRQGWGLGLALSGELVAMHGGRLRLESSVGAGTTAAFDLPLA